MGKTFRRLQGVAALAILAFLGRELALLAMLRFAAPELRFELRDSDVPDVLQVFAPPGAPMEGLDGVRVLLARARADFDPSRSVLTFEGDGAQRAVPRTARTILVHGDRRLEVLAAPPPGALLEQVRQASRAPPRQFKLRAWFQSPPVAATLRAADERLRRFWD